jgi:HSP20 family protein
MANLEKVFASNASLLSRHAERLWSPACDIYRTAEGWVVKFDLAGVEPDEVSVSLVDCQMIVRGTRRDRTLREGMSHYRMEITYSRFERVLSLPCDLTQAAVKTEYKSGLLTVTFLTSKSASSSGGHASESKE